VQTTLTFKFVGFLHSREIFMSILDILAQAVAANAPDQHFDEVVANAPANELGKGVAEAFRSDQTPDMGQMVGQLFGNSNGSQQAGMLNQVLASLGPAAIAAIAGGVLGRLVQPSAAPAQTQPNAAPTHQVLKEESSPVLTEAAAPVQITPAQASTLSVEQVKEIVNTAGQQNPSLADQLGNYYAEHSGLIKTLGAAALAITLARMKNNMENKG
jgi:hypothetical protein